VFEVVNMDGRGMVLVTLWQFLCHLPDQTTFAAAAELVDGNAVELVVGHLAETGDDPHGAGVLLLTHFSSTPRGRVKICTEGVAERLMKWLAPFLQKVRSIAVNIVDVGVGRLTQIHD
jgi:hypothetical protein